MTAYDVRYDGNVVRFFDRNQKEFEQVSLTVHSVSPDVSEIIEGLNKLRIKNGMVLVYDSSYKGQDVSNSYTWYVITSALLKGKIRMNTSWTPCFIWVDSNGQEHITNAITENTNLIVVPNTDTANKIRRAGKYLGYLILPLIETITNIFPIHTGLTLTRLACRLRGAYDETWMNDLGRVMCNLFDTFVDRFNEISTKEGCPFSELHSCLFRNTFRASISERPDNSMYQETSFYYNGTKGDLAMIVKSSLVSNDDYGDIAWSLLSNEDRANMARTKGVKKWNGVFSFVPAVQTSDKKEGTIVYRRLVIFPRMEIAPMVPGHGPTICPYGSMIGLTEKAGLDFRGELFDDMSPREEIIISFLFDKFINNSKSLREINVIEIYRMVPIPGKCRPDFIEKIRQEFVKWKE